MNSTPSIIVVDTEAIVRVSGGVASPEMRVLLQSAQKLHYRAVVPHVVIDELVFQFERELTEKMRGVNKAKRDLARHVRHLSEQLDDHRLELDLDGLVCEYQCYLSSTLLDLGAHIAPYPEVDHPELVKAASLHLKPFSNSDKGYKDALVWATAIEEAHRTLDRSHSGVVVFVSGNGTDFARSKKSNSLHPDLFTWAKAEPIPMEQFKLFTSIDEVNGTFVTPRLSRLSDIENRIKTGVWLQDQVQQAIHWAVSEWFENNANDTPYYRLGVPEGFEWIDVYEIEEVRNLSDHEAVEITGDTTTIKLLADVSVRLAGEAEKYSELADMFGEFDPDNLSSVTVSVTSELQFSVQLILYGQDEDAIVSWSAGLVQPLTQWHTLI